MKKALVSACLFSLSALSAAQTGHSASRNTIELSIAAIQTSSWALRSGMDLGQGKVFLPKGSLLNSGNTEFSVEGPTVPQALPASASSPECCENKARSPEPASIGLLGLAFTALGLSNVLRRRPKLRID